MFMITASPSNAANELIGKTITSVQEASTKSGLTLEKVNDVDAAKMDAAQPRPAGLDKSQIYLLFAGDTVLVILAMEDTVIINTDPLPAARMNKLLGRTSS